jgi:hypothetical protein
MNGQENKTKCNVQKFQLCTYIVFSAIIIVLCAVIFIYNYESVYDKNTNGGYFSASDGVIFKYIILALLALLASVILKIIWRHRLSILVFIAVSIVLPILCYQINYHSFNKDAMLYPLVKEGGALHFITIHDFDFDGVNDEYDYTGDDVRELSSTVYCSDPRGVVSSINYTIVGKGGKLNYSWCSYHSDKVTLHLHKSRVTYDHIKVTLVLTDSVDAKKIVFYLFDSQLETTIENENTVSVIVDGDVCAKWQQTSLEELITVSIRCDIIE